MKEISFKDDVLPQKDRLYRLALRITLDTAEAEDVVQDTLIKVWEQMQHGVEMKSVEAYSQTVCRNLALDVAGRAGHGNVVLDEADEQKAAVTQDLSDVRERLSLIRNQMDALPEVQRSIMELRDIEGKTYQEIGNILQLTESQVKVYLFRARAKIREQVKKIEEYGL